VSDAHTAVRLSPQTIDALADVISGGPGLSDCKPIGIYRTGPKIEKFMRACNVDFQLAGSRVPSLVSCLIAINNGEEAGTLLPRIIEAAADPRDFASDPERHDAVIAHLNRFLVLDGFDLQRQGSRVRLVAAGHATPVIDQLARQVDLINFDTVRRDLDRALDSADRDPEDAVTAACSTVESVCRSILVELGQPLPDKKDIQGLYKAVRTHLGLSPDRPDLPSQIADDVRKVLSGIATSIEGIGALRTHAGDAHGRERGFARIDGRIARLAIHAASSLALFLIETWQKKFPAKDLHKH